MGFEPPEEPAEGKVEEEEEGDETSRLVDSMHTMFSDPPSGSRIELIEDDYTTEPVTLRLIQIVADGERTFQRYYAPQAAKTFGGRYLLLGPKGSGKTTRLENLVRARAKVVPGSFSIYVDLRKARVSRLEEGLPLLVWNEFKVQRGRLFFCIFGLSHTHVLSHSPEDTARQEGRDG